jgi:hypothetical protein
MATEGSKESRLDVCNQVGQGQSSQRAIGSKSKHVNKLSSHYTHFVFQMIKYTRVGLYPLTHVSSNGHVRKPVKYLTTYDAM